jgi:small conductance mechanosensitive channel
MEESADVTGQVDVNPAAMVERVDSWIDAGIRLVPNMIVALAMLLVFWFVARWIGALIRRAASSRDRENLGAVVGSFARWVAFVAGGLVALTVVIPSLRPGDLVAGLGVSSIAIGFAFKDILQNWLAGILILIRQPFAIGDQIQVQDYEGTVERIESRATLIHTYDGQRVVIPNSDIYTRALTVRTAYARRRSEYDFGIGYSDDLRAAQQVIAETIAGVEGVAADPPPQALAWSLDPSWVTIRARWWTRSDRASVVATWTRVLVAVKLALDEAGVDMPYDTQVLLLHDQTEETDGDRRRQREGWPAGPNDDAPRPARLSREEAREAERG